MKTATRSAKAMFFVDYDIVLAHVPLCHAANCSNSKPSDVFENGGLVVYLHENLKRHRVITI